jgi:capsule polysaccharide export protein KpsE/RkpR
MTRQYTATARIVIEPPAGADLRSAMAVSPIYLESLKTYEHFADSDNLFQKAVEHFGLRVLFSGSGIESMKRRVLKISTVRNTRILEISATLPDPRKAQALAQFLAASTVELNRSMVTESDQELIRGIEQQQRDARARLDETEAAWARLLATEPVDDLNTSLESAAELRASVQQQILNVQLELADAAQREKQGASDAAELRKEQANARARLEEMRKQIEAIDRRTAETEKLVAARQARRDKLEADRKAGQAALTAAETRLREARGDAGYRGERLKVIDPGIVPERPSSPDLPLNLLAALLLGLVLPILYLTFEMHYQEQRASDRRSVFRAVAKARDD